jgi:hypothetical protein
MPMPGDFSDEWIDKACEADPLPMDVEDDWSVTPPGPPLTLEEIDAARVRLGQWQSAQTFSDDVLALCHRCASSRGTYRPAIEPR